jgi:hypothetical protein
LRPRNGLRGNLGWLSIRPHHASSKPTWLGIISDSHPTGTDTDDAPIAARLLDPDFWPTDEDLIGKGRRMRRDALPPVLKITQCVVIGLENSLLYLILQELSRIRC